MHAQNFPTRVLVIEDDEDDVFLIQRMLSDVSTQEYRFEWLRDYDGALAVLMRGPFDVCLLDYRLGWKNGLDFLREVAESPCKVPVIVLTGHGDREVDLEAMKAGAADYLPKRGLNPDLLERSIRYAIERARTRESLRKSRDELEARVDERTRELTLVNETLRLNMERLHLIHDAARAGIWEWDPDTGEGFWSEELWHLYGLEPDSCEPTFEVLVGGIHPDDREKTRRSVLEAVRNGDRLSSEWRVIGADGTHRWLMVSGGPLHDAHGRPVRYVGIIQDVTERKKAEEERLKYEQRLQQARKAESLGRMAGAIAHNFNNMLGAVIGNLDLALDEAPPGSDLRTCLDEAMAASRRAATVSRFMLTYLGKTTRKAEPVCSARAIHEACVLLNASIPPNVRLKTEIDYPGPLIQADRAYLTQILTNLMSNAVEAIGDREGEIFLALDSVAGTGVREEAKLYPFGWVPKAKEYVRISVTDTGMGIGPENLDNIFDPFFSTKFIGRGLGLSVVSGLLRPLGGAIAVESQLGRGTIFKVFLPVSERERTMSREKDVSGEGPSAAGGLVLVVDDEEIVCRLVDSILKDRLGYEVVSARDGSEALEIFQGCKDEVSLVLLDLSMPGMDGWEVLSGLRAIRPDVPVILSSGYDEAQVNWEDRPERPQAFLPKPYGVNDLKETVEAVLKACRAEKP